jgi:hypothetical protein
MPFKGGIDAEQTTPQMREKMEKWVPSDQQTYRRNKLYRQARQFLSDILADGPQPYSTIVARATEAGISLASLLTAKRALRVESRKVNKSTLWYIPAAT